VRSKYPQIFSILDKTGGKLILIGDPHQLPEIEAGGVFHVLARRLPAVELHENIRQHQAWERTALAELRNGSVAEALAAYHQNRRLIVGQSRDEDLARAAADWYRHVSTSRDMASALLLAADSETVRDLNRLARCHLAEEGVLRGPIIQAGGRDYQMGDRVICLQNDGPLGVLNGDLATIIRADVERRSLTVRLDRDPRPRHLPGRYLDEGQIEHGYALTGHKAQGITVDRTFAIIGDRASREWVYVAMSRGRDANIAYLACPEARQPCRHLSHQLTHDPLGQILSNLGRDSRQIPAVGLDSGRT
jgi:ATP-dependent exoDNAse (exonuclease V) alpha subunit